MWNKELELSKKIAVLAGEAIMKIYNQVDYDVEYKADDSPLTIADKEANRIIIDALKNAFPNYSILSEEEKDNKTRLENDYCFIVDPLDGTKEFIKHNDQFTVNIALAYKHKSVMGVIYAPATRNLYWAMQGNGAFKQDQSGKINKISVSNIADISKDRIVMSSSHGCDKMNALLEKYHLKNYVKMGSSLKGCLIAEGSAEIYYRYNPTMEWDTAAMQCIIEEAGGIFRQMDDTEMIYNRENCLNEKGFYAINCEKNRLT